MTRRAAVPGAVAFVLLMAAALVGFGLMHSVRIHYWWRMRRGQRLILSAGSLWVAHQTGRFSLKTGTGGTSFQACV